MSVDLVTDGLHTAEGLSRHLDALVALDPRLATVRAIAGPVPVREAERGFAGMARVVCGQQLSVASARAIWTRYEALDGATDPLRYLALEEAQLRAVGLSSGKYRTIKAIAEAVVSGALQFDHIESLPAPEAIALLTQHKGIGPWTAEIYLLFCAGHPDVFPSGDLALQKAVALAFGLDARPDAKDLAAIAEAWSPHRGAAALLLWRYFGASREREGIAL